MLTLALYFIDAKFHGNAGFIYFGTFLLDLAILELLCKIFGKG